MVHESDFRRLLEDSNIGAFLTHHCVFCGTWCNRCQELNLHYRLHHPSELRGALARSAQITHMMDTESPCQLCHREYRRGHCCTVATQVAVLQLYYKSELHRQPASQTCLVCNQIMDNMGMLHQHLASQHGIQVHDWSPSRDALMYSEGCAHCGATFESRSGLQRHILDGRCPSFNPDASPQQTDFLNKWMTVMRQGDFTRAALSPGQRQDLTLACQMCGTRYSRQNDLGSHLQQSHSQLWTASQEMLRFLIQTVQARHGCLCNPCCNDQGKTHICVMFRQIAMMYFSSICDVLVPTQFVTEVLEPLLNPIVHLPFFQPVRDVLFTRQFAKLWQDPGIVGFLKQWCIHCGDHYHPAELVIHQWQRHHEQCQWAAQIKFQIIACLWRLHEHDLQCMFCGLLINPPVSDDDTDPSDRWLNLQIHLTSNCPIAQQAALLLLPVHGREHGLGSVRPGTAGVFQAAGSFAPGSQSVQKRKRRGATLQAPKARSQRWRRTASQPVADATGTDGHDETHGLPDAAAREEPAVVAQAGLLRFLCPGQSTRRSADPHTVGNGMEGAPQAESSGTHLADHEDVSAERNDQGGALAGEEDGGQQRRRGFMGQGGDSRSSAENWSMDISTMEPRGEEIDPGRQRSIGNEQGPEPVSTPGRTSGGFLTCDQISLVESPANGDTVVPPVVHEAERSMAYPHRATAAGPLELAGTVVESPHAISEQASGTSATMSPPNIGHSQEQGQRQDQWENPPALNQASQRHALRHAFRSLIMDNGESLCYANSGLLVFLWAVLSRISFQETDWGEYSVLFSQLLLHHGNEPQLLTQLTWFHELVRGWSDNGGQADSTEFSSLLIRRVAPRCCSNCWERRVQHEQNTQVHDRGDAFMPITLQIDMEMLHDGRIQLGELIRHWHQELGMSAGLVSSTELVCFHVDRFVKKPNGQLRKLHVPIDFTGPVDIPTLTNDIQCDWHGYQTVAAFSHSGDATSGHYQALLKVGASTLPTGMPVRWLHCDDNRMPLSCAQIPMQFAEGVSCVWLCRQENVEMHDMLIPDLDGQSAHPVSRDATTQAMLAMLQHTPT